MTARRRILVVGAGVSGLTAARQLARSFDVVVLDKGRGVGGRLATRRIGEATFDHGAQFLTTHSADFADIVAGWERAGIAQPWFRGAVGPTGTLDADGHTRFRGITSMNAIAKHLAEGLDVRTSTRIATLAPTEAGWRARIEDGSVIDAAAVVLTAPVPQALALLDGGRHLSAADVAALEAIRYEPCLAVLAPLDGPSGLGDPGAVRPDAGPIDWLADNHRKGVSAVPAVTIHAGAAFSRDRWDDDDDVIVAALLEASGLDARPLDGQAQVQRWRYARPSSPTPERCFVPSGVPPMVLAGDAFGEAKVEGAARSGLAAAAALAELLGATDGRST